MDPSKIYVLVYSDMYSSASYRGSFKTKEEALNYFKINYCRPNDDFYINSIKNTGATTYGNYCYCSILEIDNPFTNKLLKYIINK